MGKGKRSVGLFAIIGWIIRMVMIQKRQRRLVEIQAELQNKLLDKFSSTQEVLDYLHSDAGTRFLHSATIERSNPYGRILASLQAGIILTLAGAAFLAMKAHIEGATEGFMFVGALGLAVGIGFLLSGAIAYYLSKSWGLINGHDSPLEGDQ